MRYRRQMACLGLLFSGLLPAATTPAATETWVDYAAEGTIDRMDAVLAPELREGLVLAAIFACAPTAAGPDLDEAPDRALFAGVVANAEVTFDRNHVLVYAAAPGEGDQRLELIRGETGGEQPRDVYALTLPLEGTALGEGQWEPRWLQLWFFDEPGRLLPDLAPQPPPEAFARGWWRVTFWNAEGTASATAEGALTAAGPAGAALTPAEQVAALEQAVLDLGDRLDASESRARGLERSLASARERIAGLQQTVDVLIEERQFLQADYERLQAVKEESPAALREELAASEAEAALWAEKASERETQNNRLLRALREAEEALAQLQRERAPQPAPAAASTSEPAPAPTSRAAPAATASAGPIVVVPAPSPAAVETSSRPVATPAVVESAASAPEPEEAEKTAAPARRRGKFSTRPW
ncbi:MAG: hypothetical protein ACLFU2_05640 [Opitutales bacterium]